MNTTLLPSSWPAPATYSHGIQVPGGAQTVYVAGQVGARPDGSVVEGVGAQTALAYDNIRQVLAQAGLELKDIVKMTIYLLTPDDYADYSAARSASLGPVKPAATLVYVGGLARPEYRVEIDVIAAR